MQLALPTSMRALRNRNYRIFFGGQLTSMLGTWMQTTVQAWLVFQMSHSATWLGLIAFCMQFSSFAVAPYAGVIADRFDRRKVLLWTEWIAALQAFLLAALVLSGHVELWQIAILSVILGVINAFELTARHSFVIEISGKSDLSSAIVCNSVIINSSRLAGPAMAGIGIVWLGEGWCFVINGLSYFAIIFALLALKLPPRATRPKATTSPLTDILLALQYIRGQPVILKMIALSAFISLLAVPYGVLLPVFAKEILHGDATTLAWLTGASGAGAILGAFSLIGQVGQASFQRKLFLRLIWIGLSLALLAAADRFWLSVLGTFAAGMFINSTFPAPNAQVQSTLEEKMRGRVMSLYTMAFLGAMPLGSLLFGWITDQTGPRATVGVAASVFVISGVALNCIYGSVWVRSGTCKPTHAATGPSSSPVPPDSSAPAS